MSRPHGRPKSTGRRGQAAIQKSKDHRSVRNTKRGGPGSNRNRNERDKNQNKSRNRPDNLGGDHIEIHHNNLKD